MCIRDSSNCVWKAANRLFCCAHYNVKDVYKRQGNKPNATVMVDVDRQGFVDLLADRLKFYA